MEQKKTEINPYVYGQLIKDREFPGSLLVRIWYFYSCGPGAAPGLGTQILHQAAAHCYLKSKK